MHLFVRPFCFLVKLSYYDRKKGARKTFQSETVKGDISKEEAFRKTFFKQKRKIFQNRGKLVFLWFFRYNNKL